MYVSNNLISLLGWQIIFDVIHVNINAHIGGAVCEAEYKHNVRCSQAVALTFTVIMPRQQSITTHPHGPDTHPPPQSDKLSNQHPNQNAFLIGAFITTGQSNRDHFNSMYAQENYWQLFACITIYIPEMKLSCQNQLYFENDIMLWNNYNLMCMIEP